MIDPRRADEIVIEEGAAAIFKIFTAYRQAGFTRREALELTKINLAGAMTAGQVRRRPE